MRNTRMKIFIASSIEEFARERDVIENYLWRKNTGGNISVVPLRCENADPAMSVTRKQDDFCKFIEESDVCIFIFGKKIGDYTVEEYEYARGLIENGRDLKIIALCNGEKIDDFYKRIEKDGVPCYDYSGEAGLIGILDNELKLPSA